jgi:hypothetical protein
MKVLILVGICSLTIFGCGGTENKATGKATVVGRVTELDSTTYLAGARVYESRSGGNSAVTDSMGYFRLENVPFDSQQIFIELEGYKPDTVTFYYPGELDQPLVSQNAYLEKAE